MVYLSEDILQKQSRLDYNPEARENLYDTVGGDYDHGTRQLREGIIMNK